MDQYRVVRYFMASGVRPVVIGENLSLEEAQKHCNNPQTSSKTATGRDARLRTQQFGEWFDGYERQQ